MLTDQELQSLRNLGNEAEAAADEIQRLSNEVHELQQGAELLLAANDKLMKSMDAVVYAQRERCAKLCEAWMTEAERHSGPEAAGWLHQVAQHIRKA